MQEPFLKRKEKQAFLNKVIIERNYNKEEFTEFIDRKKSNAGDIDRWNAFELEKIVDEYKRIPNIYYSYHQFDEKSPIYENIDVELKQNGFFKMIVKDLNKTITRKFEDVEWIFKAISLENTRLFFPKFTLGLTFKSTDSKSLLCFRLKCYLEYLFVFYHGFESAALKSFFTYSEEEFILFRQVYLTSSINSQVFVLFHSKQPLL